MQEFDRNGFVVIPNALSAVQVNALNVAIDRYLNKYPDEWVHFDESLIQTVNVLPRVTDFDSEIEYNATAQQYQRYFSLSGQDWVAGNTRAVALEGVVAVIEKTIRLEH